MNIIWILYEPDYSAVTSVFDFIPVASCNHGDVRLRGDDHYVSMGRVEVCMDSVWTTVCDRYWTHTEASVVCTQLGYSPYGRWLT